MRNIYLASMVISIAGIASASEPQSIEGQWENLDIIGESLDIDQYLRFETQLTVTYGNGVYDVAPASRFKLSDDGSEYIAKATFLWETGRETDCLIHLNIVIPAASVEQDQMEVVLEQPGNLLYLPRSPLPCHALDYFRADPKVFIRSL